MKQRIFFIILILCLSCSRNGKIRKQRGVPLKKTAIENNDIEVLSKNEGLISNNIKDILLKGDEIYCLADTGLIRINKNNGKMVNHPFPGMNFSSGLFYENQFWVLEKSGIYRFLNDQMSLVWKQDSIADELIPDRETLFFGLYKGEVFRLNADQQTFSSIRSFTNLSLLQMQGDAGDLYLTDGKNLLRFDPETGRRTNLISFQEEAISSFLVEGKNIYFGYKDLYSYDRDTGFVVKLVSASASSNYTLTCLFKDGDNLYAGRTSGVLLLNLATAGTYDILQDFFVKDAEVNCITQDENIVFIGTRNHGLIKFIKKTQPAI
ncbi:MAG: hypothetical protein PHF84_07175 [bacterium]|nr:hypothetical protein [bacterium]